MTDYLGASREEVIRRRNLVMKSLEAINEYNYPKIPCESQTFLKVKANLIVATHWSRVLRLPKEVDCRYIEASIPYGMRKADYDKPVLSLVLLNAEMGSDILVRAEVEGNLLTYYWRASCQPPYQVTYNACGESVKVYAITDLDQETWAIKLREKLFAINY